MHKLHITSPLTRGEDVEALQRLLTGANRWEKDFHPGAIDGEYGPATAAAVYRAKFFLGYPKRKISKSAGKTLVDLLRGKRDLPLSYLARMKRRQSQSAKRKAMRLAALDDMKARLHLAESPEGSNHNWLTDWWYGYNGARAPWCAISVSRAYIKAGSKVFKRGVFHAYVPSIEAAAIDGAKGLMRVPLSKARPGDIITMNFDGGVADHVGVLEAIVDGVLDTIEGNTDAAGGADGGEQIRKTRTSSVVSMVIRVLR